MSENKSTVENGALMEGKDEKGRFVPGHSLAKGRPEGSRNFATIYRAALKKIAEANGKSLDEIEDDLVKVAINRAKDGDFRFYQDLMDRLNGKPVVRTENKNVNADLHKLQDEEKERLDNLIK